MTIPAAISIAAAALGLGFALLSLWMARAPGWKEMRYFSLLAVTGGLYCLFDLGVSIDASDAVISWAGRLCMFVGAFHGTGWLLYRAAQERRQPHRWELSVLSLATALAISSLLPGVILTDVHQHHTVAWLGVTYNDTVPTTLGAIAYAGYCATLLFPLVSYLRSARRAVPGAAAHATGLGVLLLTAVNDAAVGAGLLRGPYLLEFGFTAAIGFAGGAALRRFVDQARQFDVISRDLEAQVQRRTRELADAQLALLRAEKLAALGRVAAGVAHEINNPASVVLANLDYLRMHLEDHQGQPPADIQECLGESAQAVRRIARIVRQLVDAGRAGRESIVERHSFPVRETLEAAVASARLEVPPHVAVQVAGPEDLYAMGDASLLEQVAVNLVINAAHAVAAKPGSKAIGVSARRDHEKVIVEVSDDGPGIPAEIREHVFEPFYTTKRIGKGTGLGLAVSLGLMRAQAGNLVVASTGPDGTCMRATLDAADTHDARASSPAFEPTCRSFRMLLVDDDEAVRRALGRQLQPYFDVTTVDGVDSAIELVQASPNQFDIVLCDMTMPNGGGRRFDKELNRVSAKLAGRTIYFTGGLTDESSRRFFANHAPRALQKPIDPKAVLVLAESLVSSGVARSR